jgi:hypothetical protein
MDRVKECIEAQKKFCEQHAVPNFSKAYTGNSGVCPFCMMGIYSERGGYSVGNATSNLITCCPFCHQSFVE